MKKNIPAHKSVKILLIAFSHFIHDVYTSFLSPILPILMERFALSYTSLAFLRVILRIPSLLNPFIGSLTDRTDLKYFVALTPAITGTAMCLMGNMPDYLSLVLLLFIAGISSCFFHVPAPSLLKNISDKKLGMSMSAFQIGGELSRSVGPVVVVAAISLWGFEGLYRLAAFGILVSCILLLKLGNTNGAGRKEENRGMTKDIGETFRYGKNLFIFISGLLLIKILTASVIATFLPIYLVNLKYKFWQGGLYLSLVQASAVVGVMMTGTLSDRIGRKPFLLFTAVASPISIFLFLSANDAMLALSLILVGLICFSNTPVILALIQEAGFKYPSIANGIYMMLNFALSGGLILIFGKFADFVGLKKAIFFSAVISILCLIPVFVNRNAFPELSPKKEQPSR